MKNIKPVFISYDNDIQQHDERAILDGIATILQVALVINQIEVKNFGSWNNGNQSYESIDWYVQRGYDPRIRRNQIDAKVVLTECLNEPWQRVVPHYDVMVLSHDLYVNDNNFVFGIGQRGLGTIISPFRFRCGDIEVEYELLKTLIIHELGHVFGLVDKTRQDLDYRLGPHCKNRCAMRQGMSTNEWAVITEDRLQYGTGTFCSRCSDDLKKYFI